MMALLTSRSCIYAAVFVVVLSLVVGLVRRHDAAILAAVQVEQDHAIAAAKAETEQRVNAALTRLQAATNQRNAALTAARRVINAAPVTTTCRRAPAIGAALDSLRADHGVSAPAGHP